MQANSSKLPSGREPQRAFEAPANSSTSTEKSSDSASISTPSISLPQGGGAIRGIGEKFEANPVTGTASWTVPIATSPGRSGFGPQISASYDSGAGNGLLGFGWHMSLPSITRKTDRGLPQYRDAEESDVFIISGSEDLVPVLENTAGPQWQWPIAPTRTIGETSFTIRRYRPRVEGLFALIERWTNTKTGEIHWRSISKDNVTTVYGEDNNSRIFDPSDSDAEHPTRIFSWLLCKSYDDRGNAIVYEYKAENSENINEFQAHESNRTHLNRSSNRYLKRIKYGNRISRLVQPDLSLAEWLFEVVFDYGEHDAEMPTPAENTPWLCRNDAFSSYRSGFEVRFYRLCQRVLMFHHFPNEPDVGKDCLVRSTDFTYRDLRKNGEDRIKGNPNGSFIAFVTSSSYIRIAGGNSYLKKSLPPLEFEYSEALVADDVRDIDAQSLENLPFGVDGTDYRWVDLNGEGVSGILSEQSHAWFYKSNLGDGKFGAIETLSLIPSQAALNQNHQRLLDLAGDGRLDLVQFDGEAPGFSKRTFDNGWESYRLFSQLPNIAWDDPNMQLLDLTGDGHADILITEQEVYTWYPSLAEEGFGSYRYWRPPFDEEQGPQLVFSDTKYSIFLADMSGDGLTDLVRIRNGEVCYWPNLGYGHFGAKVAMTNAPLCDFPDVFDQRRIQLADIDGTGTCDLIYLGVDGVSLYFNQCGNAWSDQQKLMSLPPINNESNITTIDLLGNGTACLVWSTRLPGYDSRQMHYIDLMGGQKPYLLVSMKNNLGTETRVSYVSSTKFYLEDKLAGTPWVTRIPFPVHVVERVETFDHISRNYFVSRYAYHHGHFDGIEREFRGFGLVEQFDTEEFSSLNSLSSFPAPTNIEEASHVPPTMSKTWFHTGAFQGGERISRQYEHDYYRESGLSDDQLRSMMLDDTVLPNTFRLANGKEVPYAMLPGDLREACRALKGSVLRREVYGLDSSQDQHLPYTVSERNYTIELLQPQGPNQHAVFMSHPREVIDFNYERKHLTISDREMADPRVLHGVTLQVDRFGNVLQSVSIGYGRRRDDPNLATLGGDLDKQKRTLITYNVNRYTNDVVEDDRYRTPLPCESFTYELLKMPLGNQDLLVTNLLRLEDLQSQIQSLDDGAHDLLYEDVEGTGAVLDHPYRRLIEHLRILYRRDDLTGPLPLGQLQSFALPFESYKQAFTPGLIKQTYVDSGQSPQTDLDTIITNETGYVHNGGDANWWSPSGKVFYSPNTADTPAQELSHATTHFYLACRTRNPFHTDTASTETVVTYDDYDLLLQERIDALGSRITVGERDKDPSKPLIRHGQDYRVLRPILVMDPNRNQGSVAFDTLGMVVGTAVMGKPEENLGDTLNGFVPTLTDATIDAYFLDPISNAQSILGKATTRVVYDYFAYYRTREQAGPAATVTATLARQTHVSDLADGEKTVIQHSFSYIDGYGREIQKKKQGEPGPVPRRDSSGRIVIVDGQPDMTMTPVNPRWVGSGWTVYNNKGKPIRQYEPFFSNTHQFEFDVQIGVSSVTFYDPIERAVGVLHANHTWSKIVFDAWSQESWDVNDTVLVTEPKNDPHVGDFFRRLPDASYLPTWHTQRRNGDLGTEEKDAATKSAIHANTPALSFLDALGRTFFAAAHNKFKRSDAPEADLPSQEFYSTRFMIDIEGNQREVIDAMGRSVIRFDYDMVGNVIHHKSMEAGERWLLCDVQKKALYTWDLRKTRFHLTFDQLRRPIESYIRESGTPEALIERTVYGETVPDPEVRNLRGKVIQLFDQAGVITTDKYDFKGNMLGSDRRFSEEYKKTLNWSTAVDMEASSHPSSVTYNAFNLPTALTTPDKSVTHPVYNDANLLERIETHLRGAAENTVFVSNIDYNAKGQPILVQYGNGVNVTNEFDSQTFRLINIVTRRLAANFPDDAQNPPPSDWPGSQIQNLHYTYDPVGNITRIRDDAQQAIFFRGKRVLPSNQYTYDANYQLIEAFGREHLGQVNGTPNPPSAPNAFDLSHTGLDHPNDGKAMGTYLQNYQYDFAGNIVSLQHRGSDPAQPGWTRTYSYNETSNLEASKTSNRLSSTSIGAVTENYSYSGSGGVNGNMTSMPHLSLMRWNAHDQLQATSRQIVNNGGTPEITWYVYDSGGQRVRKVTERQAGVDEEPKRMKERIYLGDVEVYREYDSNGKDILLERETLHIMDEQKRIAVVETRTKGNDESPSQLIRYQYNNHLGTSCLELDDSGKIISYEEYYPHGGSSYQAVRSHTEMPKRYRYAGKERDEENGLDYVGARYYASWLGRWTAADPEGLVDGPNLYRYCRNNPVVLNDPGGTNPPNDAPPPQGAGFTYDGTSFRFGPLSPPPVSAGCDELNPICRGFQFNLTSPKSNSSPQINATVDIPFAVPNKPTTKDATPSHKETTTPTPEAPAGEKVDTVGEPGLAESLIPIWGSGRSAIHHFQSGNYVRGVLYTALAISDVFLVKSLFTAGGKLLFKTVAEAAAKDAAENVAKNTAVKTGEEVVHLTTEAAEVGIKESEKVGGKWGVMGLDASKVPLTNAARNRASFVLGDLSGEVALGEASKYMVRPPIFGPVSLWRIGHGVRAAPLGSLSLKTGEFIAGEIFKGGTFRMATKSEYALQLFHSYYLDYLMDGSFFLGGKVGLWIYGFRTSDEMPKWVCWSAGQGIYPFEPGGDGCRQIEQIVFRKW